MSAAVLHDDNGNITSWGSTSYTWNARNQLVAISDTSLDASFKYDAVGRRVEKTINSVTTRYLYDGADIIMEMNSSGTPTVFYVRTLNIDEPLARIVLSGVDAGEIRYYHADALGSIIALTDETGTIKTQYNYSPFGVTEVIGDTSANPFQYTGRENDGDTGLYYYRARYYSPKMGRFISEDPIGLAGGINMYSYVGNSPLNFRDPWGLVVVPEDPYGGCPPNVVCVDPGDPRDISWRFRQVPAAEDFNAVVSNAVSWLRYKGVPIAVEVVVTLKGKPSFKIEGLDTGKPTFNSVPLPLNDKASKKDRCKK